MTSGRVKKAMRASTERALLHHGVTYSAPTEERGTWVLHTRMGLIEATDAEARFYCIGLADKERQQAEASA